MAVLTRAATYPEKWAIVAGNKDKSMIIMDNVIKHIFDNPYTANRFIIDPGESEEKIRRYRRKDKINFNIGNGLMGEIYIVTAENALGFGAPNIVEDEAALISPQDHALVMRMLGDQPDNFLCKIGNPFPSEHFDASFKDDNYKKIIIDYYQAISEGRLTPEYVEEMRRQPFFDILYEVKRSKLTMATDGWLPLLSAEEVANAQVDNAEGFGTIKLGVDVAGGGRNASIVVHRTHNFAKVAYKGFESDTMKLAEQVIAMTKKEYISPDNIFVDSVGIGKGCFDLLSRNLWGCVAVNGGESPVDDLSKEQFINIRAMMYWRLRDWILKGGKLERNECWKQLTKIKYRARLEGTKGKLQIMSKEDMLKEGTESPDESDALAMTFVTEDDIIMPMSEAQKREVLKDEQPSDQNSMFPELY